MPLILDTHLHLHAGQDFAAALGALGRNLARHGAGTRGAILAARRGEAVFGALPAAPPPGFGLQVTPDGGARLVLPPAGGPLYLFPGRQVVTAERLEVLALLTEEAVPDGRPADETLAAVRAAAGIPALPWAPGKWLGARGALVRRLVAAAAPGELLLADTAMRPACFPEPGPLRAARRRGLGVVAGSDPLPQPGEERYGGRYASVLDAELDPERPLESLRRVLAGPPGALRTAGRRCPLPVAALRQLRHARAGASAPPRRGT